MSMEIQELKTMSRPDLERELGRLREQRRELRFRISQNQEKRVRQARVLRQDIARILTVLKMKHEA